MDKYIGFFSSDARILYKDDIYRVMALPEDYIIKFRYQKKHILNSLYNENLLNKEAIIFFSQGNNDVKGDKKVFQNYSLRKAEIKDITYDSNTELVYYYLSLKEFIEFNIEQTEESNLPPDIFVTWVYGELGQKYKWTERIDAIKKSFDNVLFLNVNQIFDKDNNIIKPEFSDKLKESYFKLNDEKDYYIKILLYETNYAESKDNNYFDIEQESKYITIYKQKKLFIGAEKDTVNICIFTRTLDIKNTIDYIKIFTCLENEHNYDLLLKFNICRKLTKTIVFGVLSAVIAFSLFLGQFLAESTNRFQLTFCGYCKFLIIASLLIGAASAFLYNIYNKK